MFICSIKISTILILFNYKYASSGIRTHEANATDLKSVPFDHSGIDAKPKVIFY